MLQVKYHLGAQEFYQISTFLCCYLACIHLIMEWDFLHNMNKMDMAVSCASRFVSTLGWGSLLKRMVLKGVYHSFHPDFLGWKLLAFKNKTHNEYDTEQNSLFCKSVIITVHIIKIIIVHIICIQCCFALLCLVWVMLCFVDTDGLFTRSCQGCFTGTGAIVRLPRCLWSNPDGYYSNISS